MEGYRIAQKILRKSGGLREPDAIAECLGIEVYEFDLCNLKGMYSSADRHRTIFLNERLQGYMRRFVFLHEIAHDQIPEHRERAKCKPYQKIQFFGGIDKSEREANSIVAHLLIDDDQMIELIQEGLSIPEIARQLLVPEDLLLIEIEDYHKVRPDRLGVYYDKLHRPANGAYLKNTDFGSKYDSMEW